MKEDVGMEEKRKGEMIIWVSGWSPGVKEVPSESPMRQSDMASSSVTPTPSSSPHISHFFFLSPCCAQPLPSIQLPLVFFWYCASSCFILHSSDLLSLLGLCSSHTAFHCSVVLSSIKQREHVIVLTALWVRLSPRRFLSRGSFRDWNTKLKGTGGWIFNKQKHKGKKEKCGF